MNKIFVGYNSETKSLDVIKTDIQEKIERDTKGFESYSWLMGEFKTMRGARFYQAYGLNNPHVWHVNDAERLAKEAKFNVWGNTTVIWIRKS